MKVLLVNGSPRPRGCTYTALAEVASALEADGIGTEIMHIGTQPLAGCMACNACMQTGRCLIDDSVNVFLDKASGFDGYVFGSPVHFASATGPLISFMDRVFYGRAFRFARFAHKPAASVVSCRRGGASATLDQLNKYFMISHMPVVSSQYWNMVHGNTPEEVRQDLEGMQTMRLLGRNMAWLLHCIQAAKAAGITPPPLEKRVATNFIR